MASNGTHGGRVGTSGNVRALNFSFGMLAAMATPIFMGMAPIFGKQALSSGFDTFTMAALRTAIAGVILWVFYLLFFRKFLFIFPAGLIGTLAVGAANGLGSLLFYNGLLLLADASLAQVLFMTYVIFAMVLTRIYGGVVSGLSIFRGLLAILAVFLLVTGVQGVETLQHWIGVALALGGAFLYALHVVLSQRVMFEMPAPTMALYSVTFMGLTVLLVRVALGPVYGLSWVPLQPVGWWYIAGMVGVTALSRVTLFAGVKDIGGLQTILLNAAELGVTLLVGWWWLGETLSIQQWIGVAVLLLSAMLSSMEQDIRDDVYKPLPKPSPVLGPLKPGRFSIVSRVYRRPGKKIELED